MIGCTAEQDDDCEKYEKSLHTVTFCDFYICKYLVTQNLWVQVMGYNPSRFKGDDLPVENVSWDDVQKFIERLNLITGKKYRLPMEAEWEYAARGGSKSKGYKYSGSNNVEDVAWYNANSGDEVLSEGILEEYLKKDDFDGYKKVLDTNNNRTRPVGTKQPNELGIYDMSGNVWEWMSDRYDGSQVVPTDPTNGHFRVFRGGGCGHDVVDCQVSGRVGYGNHDFHNCEVGFRLARSI
jgi:formylglycine-generating enzyme required for sulfatase activity